MQTKKEILSLFERGLKLCTKCEKEKPLDNFRKNPENTITGKRSECKLCERKYQHKYKDKKDNERKEKAQSSEWYKKYLIAKSNKPKNKQGNPNNLRKHDLRLKKEMTKTFLMFK